MEWKRLFDVVVAAVALLVLAPLLIVLAILVRCGSRGPILFKQERIGKGGRPFRILKFRTMFVGADAQGPLVTRAGDPRITRLGMWLRRFKLDELPQLVNVLVGDMSLVGPRPEVARYVALWPDDVRMQILAVRPGITDPASLEYFEEERLLADAPDPEQAYVCNVLPRKVKIYARYVQTRSFSLDVRILFRTILRTLGVRYRVSRVPPGSSS